MKVSVVTVCLNSGATIEACVRSVIAQRGVEVEYIVIDGGSTDDTLDKLAKYRDHIAVLVSEPDQGLYDAMNKGLAHATGEAIGFLNSDDEFTDPDALAALMGAMTRAKADCVFADVVFVDEAGRLKRIFTGKNFNPARFELGYMPPHPSFYVRTEVMRAVGGFRVGFKIGSDFELMIKLMRLRGASWTYLPRTVVRMRLGGISTRGLWSYLTISRELVAACEMSGLSPNRPAIYGRIIWKTLEVLKGRLGR